MNRESGEKQSRESVLDKAKKLAISKAVDQYAESYEKKTGKTVNAEALKSILYNTQML